MSLTAASQAKNPASAASVAAVDYAVVCLRLINTILLLQISWWAFAVLEQGGLSDRDYGKRMHWLCCAGLSLCRQFAPA